MRQQEFFVSRVKYIESAENADISFLPALAARRLSRLDKAAAAALKSCIGDKTEFILYASKTGELERLLTIINQYKNENEVSPAVFSASIHNAAPAAFLINEKKSIPYNALAAGDDTFAAGLLAAVVSSYSDILYIYSDIENEDYVSLCLRILKNNADNAQKYSIKLSSCSSFPVPALKDYAEFFQNDAGKIRTPDYIIERNK